MSRIEDLSEAPNWFVDLFLESFSQLQGKKERLEKCGMFLTRSVGPSGEHLSGYGYLGDDSLTFLGRKYSPDKKEDAIEHLKYITPFTNG